MRYTLMTKNGKVMQFHVAAMANLYQEIYGGVVFTQHILEEVDNSANMDYTVLVD